MQRRDQDWEIDNEHRRTEGRIAVEITLRKVDPSDDLVYFIERCAMRLEEVAATTGRCTVTVCPVWYSNGVRHFDVDARLVSAHGCAAVRRVAGDLFAVIEDVFGELRHRLTCHQSGVHSRVLTGDDHHGASGETSRSADTRLEPHKKTG